ncbi:MAG TPA: hypothetical protein VNJ52_09175 [Patescibacteria group bacterium]|nr:hypothetical protein [Patescibacteria group bacterium]
MARTLCSIVLLTCLACPALSGAQASASSPSDVTVTVTVVNHRPSAASAPRLTKGDVVVRQNGNVRPVLAWEPLAGSSAGIDLAVLVDDSLQQSVALQWKDVAGFIRLLPENSRVAIAYGRYGGATMVQPFTSDRELAIKSLRIPMGSINEGASIYLSLADLNHRWPADGRRHMVLLISDGIDLFYGVADSEPGLNRNLQQAIDQSQKDGVVVDAIFASGASHFSRNFFLVNNGQGCLARLALETGGTAYTSPFETPVSFTPYLRQITASLADMYRLTFQAALPAKAGFARIRLSAEPQGIELFGPSRVYLPAAH